MRRGRRRDPCIADPETHPRRLVCLRVAADYLGLDERTVRDRIERGDIPGVYRDGKVYRIPVSALVAYTAAKRVLAS